MAVDSPDRANLEPITIHPDRFVRRTFIVAGVAMLSVAILVAAWYGGRVFLLLFAGLLVGVLLRSLADFLSDRFGWSHRVSFAVVVVALLVLVVGGGWALMALTDVSGELREAPEKIQATLGRAQAKLNETGWGRGLLESESLGRLWEGGSKEAVSKASWGALSFFGGLADFVVVLVIGFFVGYDAERYLEGFLRFIPPGRREWTRGVLEEIYVGLRRWMLGMLISVIYVGVLTYGGLKLIGVEFALPLAILTALLGFIPFFGPILSTFPAALVALASDNPVNAVWVVVLYVAIQMTEGNLVTPLVQQKAIHTPPAMTLAVVLLMGAWLGPLGMILALPLTAIAWVLVRRLYLEGVLGERV